MSSLGLADGEQLQAIEEVELSEPLVVYQHEFQRDVSALAWKPFSGTVLAVGCLYDRVWRDSLCLFALMWESARHLSFTRSLVCESV